MWRDNTEIAEGTQVLRGSLPRIRGDTLGTQTRRLRLRFAVELTWEHQPANGSWCNGSPVQLWLLRQTLLPSGMHQSRDIQRLRTQPSSRVSGASFPDTLKLTTETYEFDADARGATLVGLLPGRCYMFQVSYIGEINPARPAKCDFPQQKSMSCARLSATAISSKIGCSLVAICSSWHRTSLAFPRRATRASSSSRG